MKIGFSKRKRSWINRSRGDYINDENKTGSEKKIDKSADKVYE